MEGEKYALGKISYDFSGSIVVITGGARGQGFNHAIHFAKRGAKVIAIDKICPDVPGIPYKMCDEADFEKAREAFAAIDPSPELIDSDVISFDKLKTTFDEIKSKYGKIDVLICNAGVNAVVDLDNSTDDIWDSIVNTNYKGVFYSCKLAAPIMKETGGGSIINISSLAGLLGVARQSIYSSTKAAVAGLTRALAVELGPSNIRVNSIAPSLVLTPQFIGLNKERRISLTSFNKLEYVLPEFSVLKEDDTTDLVLWLSSNGSRFITGQNIVIDAGKSII